MAEPAPAIWGSFERNTGTWTPYSRAENTAIEVAFARGDQMIELPTCFNAVLHFNRSGGHHHQMTPAVGSKPPGYRSVLRGTAGMKVPLYWWDDGFTRMWRLEMPSHPAQHVQEVTIEAMEETASDPEYIWQWCDLVGDELAHAVELNWHAYAPEHGEEIEAAWAQQADLQLVIGLTGYKLSEWQGIYGTQRNLTTGCVRQVRRGRFTVAATTPDAYRDDSCALCTEKFADTPQWPIRRTPCNHAFHYTCLQHILRQGNSRANRCPMCRTSLAGMSLRESSTGSALGRASSASSVASSTGGSPAAQRQPQPAAEAMTQMDYWHRFQ